MLETLGYHNHVKSARLIGKLEPIKNIKPTKKRITEPHATFILNILDDLIRQFEIIDYFHLIISNISLLREQIELDLNDKEPNPFDIYVPNIQDSLILMCKNHESLLNKKNELEKPVLQMLIRNSTKDILRVLLRRSKLFERLKIELADQKKVEDVGHVAELIDLFKEMRSYFYDRLVLTPSEEKEIFLHSRKMIENAKKYQIRIDILKQERIELIKCYDSKIKVQNDLIRNLEMDCKETEKIERGKISDLKKKSDLLENNEFNESNARKERYARELRDFQKQLNTCFEEHRHQELQLRKEKWKLEEVNEAKLRKYDNVFTIRQNKYDEIKKAYDEELAVLAELEEKFKPLEAEYNKVSEGFCCLLRFN